MKEPCFPLSPGAADGCLEHPQEGHEILLFLFSQFRLQNEVEKLHRVRQREQAVIMQTRNLVICRSMLFPLLKIAY